MPQNILVAKKLRPATWLEHTHTQGVANFQTLIISKHFDCINRKKDKNQEFSFCSDKVFSNFGKKHIWNSNSMLSYYFLIFVDINKPTGHRIIKCLRTRSFILNLFPKLSHSFDHPLDSPIDSELTNHGFFHNFCWGLCSHLSLVLLCKNWQIVGCQRQSQIGVKIPTFTSITFSLWY